MVQKKNKQTNKSIPKRVVSPNFMDNHLFTFYLFIFFGYEFYWVQEVVGVFAVLSVSIVFLLTYVLFIFFFLGNCIAHHVHLPASNHRRVETHH